MPKIVNLTQHTATESQAAAGLADLPTAERLELSKLLTVPADALKASDEFLDYDLSGRAQEIVSRWAVPAIAERIRSAAGADADDDADVIRVHRQAAAVRFMVGGQADLMEYLEAAIRRVGGIPVRALTERVSEDQTQPDGSVRKVAVFRHLRFRECGRGRG